MENILGKYKAEENRFMQALYVKYHKIIIKEIKENYDKFPKVDLLAFNKNREYETKAFAKLPIPFPNGDRLYLQIDDRKHLVFMGLEKGNIASYPYDYDSFMSYEVADNYIKWREKVKKELEIKN